MFGGNFGGAPFNSGVPYGFGFGGANQFGGGFGNAQFPQQQPQQFPQQNFGQPVATPYPGMQGLPQQMGGYGMQQMGMPFNQFQQQTQPQAIPGAVPIPPRTAQPGAAPPPAAPSQLNASLSASVPPPAPAPYEASPTLASTVPAATARASPSPVSKDPNTPKSWLQGHKGAVHGVAALPNGFIASCGNDRSLLLVDLETGNYKRNKAASTLKCVAPYNHDSVVAGGENNTLGIWETNSGKKTQAFEGHDGAVTAVATLANGDVVSSSTDETVRIWDTTTGQCKHIVQFPAPVICVAPVGENEIICVSEEQPLVMIDNLGNQQRVFERLQTMDILCVAALANGDVISGSGDGTLRVWDSTTGETKEQFTAGTGGAVTSIVVLKTGQLMCSSLDGAVYVWGDDRGKPQDEYVFKAKRSAVKCLACDVKGHIITGDTEGIVAVWEKNA